MYLYLDLLYITNNFFRHCTITGFYTFDGGNRVMLSGYHYLCYEDCLKPILNYICLNKTYGFKFTMSYRLNIF